MKINYLSDCPGDYAKALDGADTLDALLLALRGWDSLAADAYKIAAKMTPQDFREFRAGLKMERKGEWAGEKFQEKFASILMPEVLFKVSIVANQFGAPWGLTYLRLKETGQLEKAIS